MVKRIFDHLLVIMFENQYRGYVMQNSYMRRLANQGIDMANYFGVMHPSQTNYITSIAGELCNVTNDDKPTPPLPQQTIVDLIEASPDNLTWRAYMDSYIRQNQPWTNGFSPQDEYPYVIKHNPFSSFADIIGNRDRWHRVGDEADFWKDLINGDFPNYAWFTPNMWNDGHYVDGKAPGDPGADPPERAPALVDQLATWLEGFFGALRFPGPDSHLPPRTLVVVTFDEADFESAYDKPSEKKYTYDGPNQVYTVLLGVGTGEEEEGYNHYSLLRTVEENFALDSLNKNDTHANWFRFLWCEQFAWGEPQASPVVQASLGGLAIAALAAMLYVAYADEDGVLWWRTFDGSVWSAPQPIGVSSGGALGMAACNDELVLIYQTDDGGLDQAVYTGTHWKSEGPVVSAPAPSFALASDADGHDAVLAWRDGAGELHARWRKSGIWAESVPVGHCSDGDLSLAVLGPSVYLIARAPGADTLNVVSYNTAPFNAVNVPAGNYAGPYDDTTVGTWSPSVFPVAHFAMGPNPATPGEPEPVLQPYRAGAPLAAATLGGVAHLVHPGVDNRQLLTERFSISGVMTPKLRVSYNASDKKTTSNGYGTLAEAGWSRQLAIDGIVHQGGSLDLTSVGDRLALAYQDSDGRVMLCFGAYG